MKNKIKKAYVLILITGLTLFSLHADQRDRWQQPEKVMNAIGVKPGMVIGEVGAGNGYFTFKLVKRVGNTGKVYANDIVRSKLRYIEDRCQTEGIANIETILGQVEDPLFPRGQMDMVIMVYVFHELEKPVELLNNIIPSMKQDSKFVILDQDPEKTGDTSGHFMTKEEILEIVRKSNFELIKIETFLPRDNIYILRPKTSSGEVRQRYET